MDRGDKFLLYKMKFHFGKKKMLQNRKILWALPKPQAIREYVLEQLPHFDL